MKLMQCQDCGDIVTPYRGDRLPRACRCGRHFVWWEQAAGRGAVRIFDTIGEKDDAGVPFQPRAFVISLSNETLRDPARSRRPPM
jgi:hypothetical protein